MYCPKTSVPVSDTPSVDVTTETHRYPVLEDLVYHHVEYCGGERYPLNHTAL